MTKANILHGWRDPNEKPEPECPLLVVFRSKRNNIVFRSTDFWGIEHARNQEKCTLLAWQYFPVWEKEEEED